MESRVTKLVEDVVVVWRRRGGRATPSFPLLISAVCGCRRGGREGGIFSIAPSSVPIVPSSQKPVYAFGLGIGWREGGGGGITGRKHAHSNRGDTGATDFSKANLWRLYDGSEFASP